MSWLWRAMYPWAMPMLRVAFRIKVKGRRHVPKKGPAILASNHLSALDHLVLPAVTRRPIVNISKVEHFESGKVKAWFFRQWHVIPVRRGAGDQGALDAAKQALREGHLFCIYPEGTRSLDGRLYKGHTGVARLALELRVPVIPVAMKGTFEAKPKGGKLRMFKPTAAVVGSPLDFSQHWGKQGDKAVCRQVTDEIMRAIQRLSGQDYVDHYQKKPAAPSDVDRKRLPHGGKAADGGPAPGGQDPAKTVPGKGGSAIGPGAQVAAGRRGGAKGKARPTGDASARVGSGPADDAKPTALVRMTQKPGPQALEPAARGE